MVVFLLLLGILSPSLWAADLHAVTVTEVVDGDILRVIYKGQEEKVRLDGVDTLP